jgi:hypothetical protein
MLRQHSSNRGMPGFVNVLGTLRGTWAQPDKNPGAFFRCTADIISNITNCEIQRARMLIARTICQVSLVGCTYDWHNRHSAKKLFLCNPPTFAGVHLAVNSTTLGVSEAYQFNIEVLLKWEMCQMELDTFEYIPVVYCSEDESLIFNPTDIAEPKIEFREEHSKGIC